MTPPELHPDLLALRRDPHGEDIHGWFGLTYANYLVLPRALLQSMPGEWQERMVACLQELDDHFAEMPHAPGYRVQAVDWNGRYVKDPAPHYDRGRTFVPRADGKEPV